MHEPLKIRLAHLHPPTAAPALAPTPCPALVPLAHEDEDRDYAESEALLNAGDTAVALERLQDLGTLLLNAGQREAGLLALKTAVNLELSSIQPKSNLIVAYVQQGEVDSAENLAAYTGENGRATP